MGKHRTRPLRRLCCAGDLPPCLEALLHFLPVGRRRRDVGILAETLCCPQICMLSHALASTGPTHPVGCGGYTPMGGEECWLGHLLPPLVPMQMTLGSQEQAPAMTVRRRSRQDMVNVGVRLSSGGHSGTSADQPMRQGVGRVAHVVAMPPGVVPPLTRPRDTRTTELWRRAYLPREVGPRSGRTTSGGGAQACTAG